MRLCIAHNGEQSLIFICWVKHVPAGRAIGRNGGWLEGQGRDLLLSPLFGSLVCSPDPLRYASYQTGCAAYQ